MLSLAPWQNSDLALLRQQNTEAMTEHLGGPESEQKIVLRHHRYLAYWQNGGAWPFRLEFDERPVGSITFWETERNDEPVFEAGWAILPEFQGRGFATGGMRLVIEHARGLGSRRYIHASPGISNLASNGVCRSAGFELLGQEEIEYPVGSMMAVSTWRFDLWESAHAEK